MNETRTASFDINSAVTPSHVDSLDDDDISLLTHDKRKCYSTVKHCKPNTVNEKKQIKENKINFVV